MGLVQVDEFSITSAVSSVIIGGGSNGSSSYNFAINTDDVYLLTYTDLYMTNDGNAVPYRFTVSGSADTSSNYDQAIEGMYSNQAFSRGGNQNINYLSNYGLGTTSSESQQGLLWLYDFNESSSYSFATHQMMTATETPEYVGAMKAIVLAVAQATDGVQFYANHNNIASGNFALYKQVNTG
tara:strand:+ start:156 stop:701 length:546 start_codon:yes stop_codon:yes gene_type:complete